MYFASSVAATAMAWQTSFSLSLAAESQAWVIKERTLSVRAATLLASALAAARSALTRCGERERTNCQQQNREQRAAPREGSRVPRPRAAASPQPSVRRVAAAAGGICLVFRRSRPCFQGIEHRKPSAADGNAAQPRHGRGPAAPGRGEGADRPGGRRLVAGLFQTAGAERAAAERRAGSTGACTHRVVLVQVVVARRVIVAVIVDGGRRIPTHCSAQQVSHNSHSGAADTRPRRPETHTPRAV